MEQATLVACPMCCVSNRKEIPLATAQHVHVQLGSLRDLDPRAGDLSRSRKDHEKRKGGEGGKG